MAFAIIKTGGRQYRVAEGDTIDVDLLEAEAGKQVVLADVLMHADGENPRRLLALQIEPVERVLGAVEQHIGLVMVKG